jgi:hypothetical protein
VVDAERERSDCQRAQEVEPDEDPEVGCGVEQAWSDGADDEGRHGRGSSERDREPERSGVEQQPEDDHEQRALPERCGALSEEDQVAGTVVEDASVHLIEPAS